MSEWIGVYERVPDHDGSVIVFPYPLTTSEEFQITGFFDESSWFCESGFEIKVTHWMPLHEPPTS